MTEACPRSPESAGPFQRVVDTKVGRDLIQLANVAGNVTITQASSDGAAEDVRQIVVGDIPAPPPGFQLRDELLERLHTQVGVGGAAVVSAVTGTPGVGKTLLAASYAWACQQAAWPVVAWVSAETTDQIIAGLAALAQRLGLRRTDDDAITAAGKAKAWLSARSADGRPGLLVFDNATQVADVAAWCPATGAVRVLITSRNRAFHQRYPTIEVDTFTPEQAIRFLMERTGLRDPQEARELARELGYLPLALAHTAALIVRRRITYAAYRRLLAAFPLADHLPRPHGDPYPRGTAESILLSVAQAEESIPAAGDVLGVLAVLSPAGVPRSLLYGGADPDGPEPSLDDLAAAAKIQELLASLADTSLISFSGDGSTVLMHRLVQRVLRERAEHDGGLSSAIDHAITLLEVFSARIPGGSRTWAARTAVETLLEQTDTLHDLTAPEFPERLLTLRVLCGRYLVELADLARAIPLLEQTLTYCERALGTDRPDTLDSCNNLATAYQSAGDLRRAIPLFERALAGGERELGADHPKILKFRFNLAYAYLLTGDLSSAISLFERTLAESERVLGGDHPDTLHSRNGLARAYQSAGDLRRAIPLFERTLADGERVLGADHPDTLTFRANLSGAYRSAGDLHRAILLIERTLADGERVLGADHPETLQYRTCNIETASPVPIFWPGICPGRFRFSSGLWPIGSGCSVVIIQTP